MFDTRRGRSKCLTEGQNQGTFFVARLYLLIRNIARRLRAPADGKQVR